VRSVNNATGVVTLYLYDGDNLFAEVDQDGNAIRRYTHNPGVDDPQAVTLRLGDGTMKTYYYMTDLSGNVTGLADGSGQVVNRYRYSPFGTAESTSEQVANPLRFKARELDTYTGLYYNRARWYDPDLGRFISEDPIGLAGGINPYAFAGNDPVNQWDPSGEACEKRFTFTKRQWDELSREEQLSRIRDATATGKGLCIDGAEYHMPPGGVLVLVPEDSNDRFSPAHPAGPEGPVIISNGNVCYKCVYNGGTGAGGQSASPSGQPSAFQNHVDWIKQCNAAASATNDQWLQREGEAWFGSTSDPRLIFAPAIGEVRGVARVWGLDQERVAVRSVNEMGCFAAEIGVIGTALSIVAFFVK
jgi:RHS repeat-associated protein